MGGHHSCQGVIQQWASLLVWVTCGQMHVRQGHSSQHKPQWGSRQRYGTSNRLPVQTGPALCAVLVQRSSKDTITRRDAVCAAYTPHCCRWAISESTSRARSTLLHTAPVRCTTSSTGCCSAVSSSTITGSPTGYVAVKRLALPVLGAPAHRSAVIMASPAKLL